MSVFSDKSESKLQKNKVSTACFQGRLAMEDGKAVEKSLSKDVYCVTGAKIINLLKALSGTGQLALTSGEAGGWKRGFGNLG